MLDRNAVIGELKKPRKKRADWWNAYNYPIVLDDEEAKKLGFNLETGWLLDIKKQAGNPDADFGFISPEGKEISTKDILDIGESLESLGYTPEMEAPVKPLTGQEAIGEFGGIEIFPTTEPDIMTSLKKLYPELLQPGVASWGFSKEELPQEALKSLKTFWKEHPEDFIRDLLPRGTAEDTSTFLRGMGVSSDVIAKIFQSREMQGQADALVKSVFPGFDFSDVTDLIQTDPDKFVDRIRTGGRTKQKQDLLQSLGLSWNEINNIFRVQNIVAEIEGVRKLLTVDTVSQKAYDDLGNWVGTWNEITHAFEPMPVESKQKDVLDAARLAFTQLGHQSKQFFISTLPNVFYRDLTDVERRIYGDDWANQVNFNNKMLRDDFRRVAGEANIEHEDWLTKHPELQPRPEWRRGVMQDASVLKDPAYWAYEFASTAPFTLATMGVTIAGTALAGPVAGIAAGIAVMTPSQAADMEQMMLQYGASESNAALVGLGVGTFMSLIEVAGDLPMFRMIAPKLFGTFKQNITREVARATIKGLAKKGLKTFGMVELTETLEEVAQQAVQNAALRTVNENQDIFQGLDETIIKTLIATAPLALLGGGAAIRPQVKEAVSNGINNLPSGLKEFIVSEEGAITPGGKPENPYMNMPIERVRKDADYGVKAAQEALAAREGKPTEPVAIPEAKIPEVPKEPWQMTQEELAKQYLPSGKWGEIVQGVRNPTYEQFVRNHREVIQKALIDNLPVPAEVLKEYPDLAAKAPAVPPARPEPVEVVAKVGKEAKVTPEVITKATITQTELGGIRYVWVRLEGRPSVNISRADEGLSRESLIERAKNYWAYEDKVKAVASSLREKYDKQVYVGTLPTTDIATDLSGNYAYVLKDRKKGGKFQIEEAVSLEPVTPTVPAVEITKAKVEIPVEAAKPPVAPPVKAEVPPVVTPPPKFAANIRLEKYPENVRPLITEWAETHPTEVETARRGVRSDEQVLADAEKLVIEVGGDVSKLRRKWKPGVAWNAEELVAVRGILRQATTEVLDAQKIAKENNSTENLLKLELALYKQADIQEMVHGLTAEAGRALRSFKQDALDAIAGKDVDRMEQILKQLGGRENIEKVTRLLGQIDVNDSIAVNKFIQSLSKPTLMDYLTELFYNSILSGPKTHIVNSLSNTANTLFSPVERFVSALVDFPLAKIQGREQERFLNEVPADLFGAVRGIPEGFRQFAYIVKNGISYDQATKWEFRPKAFKGKFGAVISMPSRFLEGADALMKAINQRAALNAEAHRMASMEKLKGLEFEERVAELLSNPTKEMLNEANLVAEYRLFRQEPGKFGKTLMNLRESADIAGFKPLRFVIPFIRTPMNLVKYGLERTPLGFVNVALHLKQTKGQVTPEISDQIARATIGSIGLAALSWYFAAGMITGAAPRDRAERERFYREGKQPFALRVGGFWISYQRLEPFNQLLSQVAILVDSIRHDDKGVDEKIKDAVATFSQNFVSQTYMSSLSDLIEMLAAPERYAGNWLNRFASSIAVPMSSATRTAAQMLDTTVRDPDNAWETIEATIPGLSTRVKSKITALGEDIKRKSPQWFPINITPVEETVLSQELERLKFDIGFAGKTISGIELSEEEQRDYQILSGQLIKQDLEKLMVAPDYWQASDVERDKMLRKTVDTARDWARAKMREKMWSKGTVEERTTLLQKALRESDTQLGKVISETPSFTHEKPNIYDIAHELNSSYFALLKGITNDSLKGVVIPSTVESWYRKEASLKVVDPLPDIRLDDINADAMKGSTFEDYFNQWQERSKITDERELAEFDKKYPNANQGNFSRRQLELLREYHKLEKKYQKAEFLEKNPELKANPKIDWIKSHPKENAELAVWGRAKLLSLEAYNQYNTLIKQLDVPSSALPEMTLPPKESIENYFKYQDMVTEGKFNSWEAQLMLLKDEKLLKFLEREPITTPIKVLELQVKHRKLFDLVEGWKDKDNPKTYLDDIVKDKNGKTARDIALAQLKKENPEWVDDQNRIEAYQSDGDAFAEKWVERGQKTREFGAHSAEDKIWLVDNETVFRWALEKKLLTENSDEWNIPALRITVAFRAQDKEYNALPEGKERANYLADNPAYRIARRQREAYTARSKEGKNFTTDEIPKYVNYYELPGKGFRRERFLVEDSVFARAMHDIMGIDIPDKSKVPSIRYDEIYEANQAQFDKLWGLSDVKSPHHVVDENRREQVRREMRFTNGKLNAFGKTELQLEAYSKFVPEKHVNDYVGYYTFEREGKPRNWKLNTGTDEYYEDDWFLMEHPKFYQEVYVGLLKNQRKDYRKVPSREVFNKYLKMLRLTPGEDRGLYREKNLDLDQWLVLKFGYKPIKEKIEEKKMAKTSLAAKKMWEITEKWRETEIEIEKMLVRR